MPITSEQHDAFAKIAREYCETDKQLTDIVESFGCPDWYASHVIFSARKGLLHELNEKVTERFRNDPRSYLDEFVQLGMTQVEFTKDAGTPINPFYYSLKIARKGDFGHRLKTLLTEESPQVDRERTLVVAFLASGMSRPDFVKRSSITRHAFEDILKRARKGRYGQDIKDSVPHSSRVTHAAELLLFLKEN
jgi:hypothetical protein